jgi:nucleoside-diphosphate-sugar epimerase
MQTILGSGGTIGKDLAKELIHYTSDIRLVSRNPKKVNDSDSLFPADVNDAKQIDAAIAGSDVVYVVVGFEYKLKVWQQQWPAFMRNVIDACARHNCKLVFFDNVYCYDRNEVPHMTEESKLNPPSKKGVVRKQLVDMIWEAVQQNKIKAIIARSADFYGPENDKSMLVATVADNYKKGKKANFFGGLNFVHTFTYTPDAAKATAILGNTEDAYNQTWHVPTTSEKLTGKDWITLFANEMHVKPEVSILPVWMMKVLGLFIPIMKEFPEMNYQYEQDYILDSSKFEKRFGIKATSPAEGVKKTVAALK